MRSETAKTILIAIALIALYLGLYLLRAQDDNRLASWDWISGSGDIWRVLAIALSGALFAIGLSRFHLPKSQVSASVAFIVSALLWHTPETIVDAARYFMQAKHLELYGPVAFFRDWGGEELPAWTDLPLIPFLYGMMFRVLGEERLLAQLLNAAFFSATVWLTALTGRRLWDEFTGRAAGLMMLGMPVIFTQAPLMLVDIGAMFFLSLASYAFIRTLTEGLMRWGLLSGVSISLAALSKYSIWPMLSVLGVIWIVLGREHGWKAIMRGLAVISVGAGLLAIAIWPMRDVVTAQVALLSEYQGPGLRRWGESFSSTFLFQIHPAVTLSALGGIWAALHRRDPRYLIVIWLPLLAVVFQVRRARYLLPMLPMFGLMAAYALSSIKTQTTKRVLALGPAITSIFMVLIFYMPFLERYDTSNLKAAAEVMNRIEGDIVEVVTLPQSDSAVNPAMSVPLLDIYMKKPIRYAYTRTPSMSEEKIAVSPLRFTWQYRNPPYYQGNASGRPICAIVSGDTSPLPDGLVPQGFTLRREFLVSTGFFAYTPFVKIHAR